MDKATKSRKMREYKCLWISPTLHAHLKATAGIMNTTMPTVVQIAMDRTFKSQRNKRAEYEKK